MPKEETENHTVTVEIPSELMDRLQRLKQHWRRYLVATVLLVLFAPGLAFNVAIDPLSRLVGLTSSPVEDLGAALANEDAGYSERQMLINCDLTRKGNRGSPGWERWCQNFPGPPRPAPPPPYPDMGPPEATLGLVSLAL